MHSFRYFIFALLASLQPSIFAMDQASSSQITVCASLPEEVWKQIFVWVNYSLENRRLLDDYSRKDVTDTFEAIQNIIPYTRVCKAMYGASAPLITSYIQLADKYLERLGGEDKHFWLRWAIKASDSPERKAIPLYRRLGADINHIDNHGETALTYAILHDQGSDVHNLIKFKADLMQPNRKGQFPIDLAYETNFYWSADIKNAGGDPENRYAYYGETKVDRVVSGGYWNYQPKKKPIVDASLNNIAQQQPAQVVQQSQAAGAIQQRVIAQVDTLLVQPPIPVVHRAQNLAVATKKDCSAAFTRGFITGVAVCCIGYWVYSKCYGADDEQEEEEQGGRSYPIYR